MSFTLDKIAPWGRLFDEYAAMFALSADDLGKRILGCGDGPSGFNSVLTERGGEVVSIDPLYRFSAAEIRRRVDETYDVMIEQTRRNAAEFVWRHIASIDDLARMRLAAMDTFLADYPQGRRDGRYVEGALPRLAFGNREFDLALCSHLLFLYSEQLSAEFHVQSIAELCRVAAEVRIFPLLELGARRSRHLDAVLTRLSGDGFGVRVETVAYEFQRGGNQMLVVRR
jgi:hypothetical protein